MDLTLTGEIAKHIVSMTKKDTKLASAMAQQFLKTVDPGAMASYLLSDDVALQLLAERIARDPERTLGDLQRMAAGGAAPRGKARLRTGRGRGPRGGKRHKLSAAQVQELKQRVQQLLSKGAANRKRLWSAIRFPSLAIYNRIMTELRAAGTIYAKGERSKTVYALKGRAAKVEAPRGKAAKAGRRAKAKRGRKPKAARAAKAAKRGAKRGPKKGQVRKAKTVAKKRIRLCPFPGCKNPAAPVFNMMCRDHKDVSKAERDKYFAERRAAASN